MLRLFALLPLLFPAFATGLFAQPGTLDGSFGTAGKLTTAFGNGNDYGQSVAVQPDGKVVVAGYADNGGQDVFALARYLPDGRPDSSFSGDGRQTTGFGAGDHRAYAVAIQPDGKILAAGYATVGSEFDFAIARYKPDGSPDPTFSGDGKTTTNLGGFFDKGYALALQPDGYIVVGGTLGLNVNSDFALVRYQPNGTLDPAFGSNGIATLSIGDSYDELHALVRQSDGRIVAAGFSDNGNDYDFAVARFLSDGSPDPAFNGTGKQTTPIGLGDYGQAVAVQPDGHILVLGYSATTSTNYDFALVRYLADGAADNSFGNGGKVVTSPTPSYDAGYALALQPDGKILAGGYAAGNGHPDFALVRYLPTGLPDPGFGTAGVVQTDFTTGTDQISALTLAPDGKIVAAGRTNNGADFDFAVARYLSGLTVATAGFSPFARPSRLAPNPVTDQTVLTYALEKEALVSLRLFDFSGALRQTFFEKEKRLPGLQSETLFIEKTLPAGAYLLQLQDVQGYSQSIILIR